MNEHFAKRVTININNNKCQCHSEAMKQGSFKNPGNKGYQEARKPT